MAEIQDFGEKIGGARKDVWKLRGIMTDDLFQMNEMERKTHVKKDNIWIRPDWVQVITDGTPQCVAYWQNLMRQAIPPRPPKDDEITQQNYVHVVCQIRDAVMAVKEPKEIDSFYSSYLKPAFVENGGSYYVTIVPEASGVVNNKVLRAAQSKSYKMLQEAQKKLFGISKDEQSYVAMKNRLSIHRYDDDKVTLEADIRNEGTNILKIANNFGRTFYYLRSQEEFCDMTSWEKGKYFIMDENRRKPVCINLDSYELAVSAVEEIAKAAQKAADEREHEGSKDNTSKRKGAFTPPQLRHVQRTGPKYRGIRHADGEMFMEDLKFRAGEFGNWLNEDDRQTSLDMAYDGLRDLARILQIRPEDVSLGGSLAIAFGARGRGGIGAGAAHYEPDRQVINLTKMSGAGCLAHEWGHALDHAIGIAHGSTNLASEMLSRGALPQSFRDVMDSLKYKTIMAESTDVQAAKAKDIKYCRDNLRNWIASEKPRTMVPEMEKEWNAAAKNILEHPDSFSGIEYLSLGRKDAVQTHPQVEFLSHLRKISTNHSIPRKDKRQIAMWASDLAKHEVQTRAAEPQPMRVKTEFYKGSEEFDKMFSKAGHGYWQSSCEMFARAFDCYISDKIHESGEKSVYLTGHADSFALPGQDGKLIYAVPIGDERKVIFEKIDLLMQDLKQRGILHAHEEPQITNIQKQPETVREAITDREPLAWDEPKYPAHFEQLSMEDLLFSPDYRTESISQKDNQSKEHFR